jgi:putative transposase
MAVVVHELRQVQRAIRLRLKPDPQIAKAFENTRLQYTQSFNAVCKLGWDCGLTHNGNTLHSLTYYDQKAATGLPSQLICSARVKAAEALKSVKAKLKKQEKASCPVSKACPIRYDANSFTVWFDRSELSIATIDGRKRLPFKLPEYYQQYIQKGWKRCSADLCRDKKKRWWLHVVMEATTPELELINECVGVDLGIVNPATDSQGNFYGENRWKTIEHQTFQHRRRLQRKGTKSAKRHLKKMSGRQQRFRRDCDHVLSKKLVKSVNKGATLVFEDLTNIRGRAKGSKTYRRRLHSWSFFQFQSFVGYKAERLGVNIAFVDPRYTSQKCSACKHRERGNRVSQAEFKCKACGFECSADINAAINIREDYAPKEVPLGYWAAVNQPIVGSYARHNLPASSRPCAGGN